MQNADARAVREVSDAFVVAEVNGDVDAFERLLADDAVIMAPWTEPLEGKAACMAFVRKLLPELYAEFEREVTLQTAELRVMGDWALERGVMVNVLKPRAGGPIERERYNFVFLFSRDATGAWKGARTIFNTIEQSTDCEVEA
jgi:ketosteroid isomerase-like protein